MAAAPTERRPSASSGRSRASGIGKATFGTKPIKKDEFAMTDFVVPGLDVHLAVMRFRLASRELFNNYFRTGNRDEEAWKAQERFSTLEEHLFDALVALPADCLQHLRACPTQHPM